MSLVQVTNDFHIQTPASGWIRQWLGPPPTYDFGVGTEWMGRWGAPTLWERRMYGQFNTSPISNGATIDKVEFVWQVRYSQGFSPAWAIGFRIGTWLGGSLGSSDWGGGTLLNNYNYPGWSPVGTWVWEATPTATVRAAINKTGVTDLEYRDMSASIFPATIMQQFVLELSYPMLRITYTYDFPGVGHKVTWTP